MTTKLSIVSIILLFQVSFNSLAGRETVLIAMGDTVQIVTTDTLEFPPSSLSFQVKSGPNDYADVSFDSTSVNVDLVATVYFTITLKEGATPGATYDKDITLLFYNATDAVSLEYFYTVEVLIPFEAVFTAEPISGDYPLNTQFTNNSTGNITGYLWNFGDGNTSTEQNPSHTYTADGIFTVSLIITGEEESDTLTMEDYITVTVPATVGGFTCDVTSGSNPLSVKFTDNSEGINTSWLWDFGDENTSTEQNPNHNYTSSGLFTVSLIVTGDGGTDTITKTDYINVFHTGLLTYKTDSDIKIFPNPVNDLITIYTHGEGICKVIIASVEGKVVYSTNPSAGSHQIDLSFLREGIYFITVITEEFFTTERIIKR